MFTKQCSRCIRSSFSSSDRGQWKCPYCAYDLTTYKAKKVNHSVNVTLIERRHNHQRGLEIYRQIHHSLNQKL